MSEGVFHNKTRTAKSIPKRLIAGRKYHYLPLYAVLRTSKLSNEGMNNSGSYHFADHIYNYKADGRYGIGILVDWGVLRLPSATDFRHRYLHAKSTIRDIGSKKKSLRILVAPAGLAREVFELSDFLQKNGHKVDAIDLDRQLVDQQNSEAKKVGTAIRYHVGDALNGDHYPRSDYDLIICMGLTEFLSDDLTRKVFQIFHSKLAESGLLYTTSTDIHKFSDKLLRNIADLHTNYRTQQEIHEILNESGFVVDSSHQTKHKLQTIVRAKKR